MTVPEQPPDEYAAFGLEIASSVELPALRGGLSPSCISPDDADLLVASASLPDSPDELSDSATLLHRESDVFELYRTDAGLHWFYHGVGRLRVRDGRRVEIDTDAATDVVTRQYLVLGPGVYSALVQRGRPVLHASAVVVDSVAVAFAGETGRGKSTAAAACYAAGHEILADDVTSIEVDGDAARASPAYPRLRIDPIAASALGLETHGPGATAGERAVDVSDGFAARPTEIETVYILEAGDGAASSHDVDARRGLFELLRTSYVLSTGEDTTALAAHQQSCADLAGAVDVRRLVRPTSLDRLDELVGVVEEDVSGRSGR